MFTSIELDVAIDVDVQDQELARTVLAKAKKHCLISNALKVPVTVQAKIGGVAVAD